MSRIISVCLFVFLFASTATMTVAQDQAQDQAQNQAPGQTQEATPLIAPRPQQGLGEEIPEQQARLELARLLAYSKRYDEALAEYDRVLTADVANLEARLGKAQVLAWTGRTKEAATILNELPKERLGPEERLLLADVAAARKDYAAAELILREYLADRPEDHRARLRLAEVLSWDGRNDASIAEYERILKVLPDDKQIIRKYAQVLSWAGRTDEAIAQLQKTLE